MQRAIKAYRKNKEEGSKPLCIGTKDRLEIQCDHPNFGKNRGKVYIELHLLPLEKAKEEEGAFRIFCLLLKTDVLSFDLQCSWQGAKGSQQVSLFTRAFR